MWLRDREDHYTGVLPSNKKTRINRQIEVNGIQFRLPQRYSPSVYTIPNLHMGHGDRDSCLIFKRYVKGPVSVTVFAQAGETIESNIKVSGLGLPRALLRCQLILC